MNAPDNKSPEPSITQQLEQQLAAAREQKTLFQVPALRRLRNVVRVYLVLGVLLQLVVLFVGVALRQIHNFMNLSGGGALSLSAFFLYAVAMWIGIPVMWLLLTAYARFLKQFRANQVQDIENTTQMILRLWKYNLFVTIIGFALQLIMYRNHLEVLLASGVNVGSVLGVVIFFFVIRRYVKTAQAELPLLAAVPGEGGPKAKYRAWRPLFLIYLAVAFVVLGLGYGLASVGSPSNVEEILKQTAQTMNASAPIQVDSETRLDTTTSGPGKRLTYYYTLVNLTTSDLDLDQFTKAMRQQLANNYKSNAQMAGLRNMQVELHYVYRDKGGSTVATIILSPSDL